MLRSKCVGVLVVSVVCFAFAAAPALAAPPEAPTTEAAELSGTTATLKGVLNPSNPGEAGTYEFLYKLSATECEGESATPATATIGGQAEAVSAEAPGLQPSATYAFCLQVHNEAGEPAISAPAETFTTAAAPPAIDSESSPSVNGTAATLSAQINPNNQETTYTFEYSTKAEGETLEGTITKVPGLAPLAGFGDQTAETRVEGLQPETPYFWRVVATNASSETTSGKVETFTTPLPPETPTLEPVELEGFTAKLKGVLNPNAAPEINSTYEFRYRLSETECEGESGTPTEAMSGEQPQAVAAEAPGLQPNENYSFCLLARNQVGETVLSTPQTVKTAAVAPSIVSQTSTGVNSTEATLQGVINPNNQETTYTFEYSTQATGETLEGTIVQVPGAAPLSGFSEQAVETKLESLLPRTKYFWRIATENATSEVTTGAVQEFTTLDGPVVVTGSSQAITRTTAAISGTVSPGGLSTRYHFVYVEEGHYNPGALECIEEELEEGEEGTCAYGEGAKTTPSEVLGATDYATYPIGPVGLEELKPGTTYHYALVASNSEGSSIGEDQTFTTSPPAPPSASTGGASGVTQTSATISGSADTHGLPGTLSFEVGLNTEGGSLEPASVSGSQAGTSVEITFSFGPYLQPETTYYFRAVATNADGTARGAWHSFTTTGFPNPFPVSTPFPLLTVPVEPSPPKPPKPLTNAQKLAKALKACHKDKKKSKRKKCERTARSKYGAKKHKK
jgi:hypothetical protein